MDDFEKLINASDLIEWIMETYPDWCVGDVRSIVDHVKDLPSARFEIIRCKDCKYKNVYCFPPEYAERDYCEKHEKVTDGMNFCSWAERRADGVDS